MLNKLINDSKSESSTLIEAPKGLNRNALNNFFTYIARCNDGSLYTGITNDIKAREERHNQGVGSKYTRVRLPLKIIYFETYNTRTEAAKREAQLKGWTKQKKENLIKGIHPTNTNLICASHVKNARISR